MIPLTIVVGFLGSGKTTFLRSMVPALSKRGVKPHVIINDFQNARLDATSFNELAEDVVAISGSCVCCGSFEELISVLDTLDPKDNGVVLLESNGVTDSINLIENLSIRPECKKYTKPLQISIVDAKYWQKRHWKNELEIEQLKTASFLYLSKQEENSAERVAEVLEGLQVHAPYARILDMKEIEDELVQVSVDSAKESSPTTPKFFLIPEHKHDHSKYHFSSWEHPLPLVESEKAFHEQMRSLPDNVVRAKGIVRFADCPDQKHLFQRVEKDLSVVQIAGGIDMDPFIICVGSQLLVEELEKIFAAVSPKHERAS